MNFNAKTKTRSNKHVEYSGDSPKDNLVTGTKLMGNEVNQSWRPAAVSGPVTADESQGILPKSKASAKSAGSMFLKVSSLEYIGVLGFWLVFTSYVTLA